MDNDNKLVQKAADLYRSLRFSMKYRGLTILSAEAGNDAIAAAIVLFVCGAVYLNWSYSQDTAAGKNLGEAALVGSQNDPLLEKQKEGKKRMRTLGSVELPSEAFIAVLKAD